MPYEYKPRLLLFILLAFSSLAFAIRMPVAAVDLEDNGLVAAIDLQAKPGSGQLFLNVSGSTVDADTQKSIKTALSEASKASGKGTGDLDFFASIMSDAESVNGPSAGAAFAILAYAELSGTPLREDFSITGTIEEGGAIGHVGGVREKAQALGNKSGISVMAVPVGQASDGEIGVSENLPLAEEARGWGLQVVEAANLSEAIAIAFSPKGSTVSVPSRSSLQALLAAFNYSNLTVGLRRIAALEMRDLEQSASAPGANYSIAVKKSLERSVAATRTLLEKGYFYSAANAAFVVKNQLDSMRLRKLDATAALSEAKRLLAQAAAGEAAAQEKTAENWEWATGSRLRRAWATDKLGELQKTLNATLEANRSNKTIARGIADDLASAESWIGAAKRMDEAAKAAGGGATGSNGKFGGEKLREYAEKFLALVERDYNGSGLPDSEIKWHLSLARKHLENGSFEESAFESSFSLAYLQAELEFVDAAKENVSAVQNLAREKDARMPAAGKWGSLWAEAYFAHSIYAETEYTRLGDASYLLNALKLKDLALVLEQNHKSIATQSWVLPPAINESVKISPMARGEFPIEENVTEGTAVPSACEPSGNAGTNATNGNESISAEITVTPSEKPWQLYATVGFGLFALGLLAFIWIISRRPLPPKEQLHRLGERLAGGELSNAHYQTLKREIPTAKKPAAFAKAAGEKAGKGKLSQKSKKKLQ
ncbi:MAG: S16 family serine protease [Candidatus Micrarchaeia archaeon]